MLREGWSVKREVKKLEGLGFQPFRCNLGEGRGDGVCTLAR